MKESTLLFPISLFALLGLVFLFVFLFIKLYKKKTPDKVIDAWRKELWDSGLSFEATEPLKLSEAVKIFGSEVFSFSSYQSNYVAKITVKSPDQQVIYYYAFASIAFDKTITKIKLQRI